MSKALLTIIYDGLSLQSHEMDVRELAPALLAMSDMLEEANSVLNGEQTKVHVNVKGSFKSGSFGIDFNVVQDFLSKTLSFIADSKPITGGLAIFALLGLVKTGGSGVLQVLKWLRNRTIKSITKTDNNGAKIVTIDNDEFLVEDYRIIELLGNIKVRQSFDFVITKPLSREGISTFASFTGNHEEAVIIHKEDAVYFSTPEQEDSLLEDKEDETYIQAVGIDFKEGNKWKFSSEEGTFYASVFDDEFVEKVQNNYIAFAKDDVLKVVLRRKKWLTSSGIKIETEIVKVVDHIRAKKQLRLPIKDK
ncbi:MAG: hypothetical protein WCP97_06685 [bacterium]